MIIIIIIIIMIIIIIIGSTLQSRPNKAGLKCPSVRPQTFLRFQWNLAHM